MNEPKKTSTKPSATIKVKKKKEKTKLSVTKFCIFHTQIVCKNAVTKIYENNIFINDK